VNGQEAYPIACFNDIGAVVYYLKAIPWQVPDFSVSRYYERLAAIHNIIQNASFLAVKSHRFWTEALKP